MKHFPSSRTPARIEGVEHTRGPLPASTLTLLFCACFAAGLVIGALATARFMARTCEAHAALNSPSFAQPTAGRQPSTLNSK